MYCNPYCNPFGPRAYQRGVLRASTTLSQSVHLGSARAAVAADQLTSMARCSTSTWPGLGRRPPLMGGPGLVGAVQIIRGRFAVRGAVTGGRRLEEVLHRIGRLC